MTEIQSDSKSHPKFSFPDGELRRNDKLVIGDHETLKLQILKWLHDSAIGGHSGRDATLHRIKSLFIWRGMNKDVQSYIRNCVVCQTSKADLAASPGLIEPLPILDGIWQTVSMDFIKGLPPTSQKHTIMVVVDRMSNTTHFMTLSHPYTALGTYSTLPQQCLQATWDALVNCE